MTSREEIWQVSAHENIVKSLLWTRDQKLLSCASDRYIKLWDPYHTSSGTKPLRTWNGTNAFTSLSHHRSMNSFAASSGVISIFDLESLGETPKEVLKWPK